MHCPSCPSVSLEEKEESAGLLIDFCPACSGAWLQAGELERLGAKLENFTQTLEYAWKSLQPTKSQCPNCSVNMECGWIKEAEIELRVCPQCKGSWIALRALRILRAYLARQVALLAPPKQMKTIVLPKIRTAC